MRKEEEQKKQFAKRLQAFYGFYRQKAIDWARDFMADEENIKDNDPRGFYIPDIDDSVLPHMPEEFQDIVQQLKNTWIDYGNREAVFDLRNRCMKPLEAKLEKAIKAWWIETWKRKYLDFDSIPSAPVFTWEKIDTWNYRMGTLQVEICGRAREKKIRVWAVKEKHLVWEFQVYAPQASEVPDLILPRIRRVAAICDWSGFDNWSVATRNAVIKRLGIIRNYYDGKENYKYTLRQFPWYYIKQGEEVPEREAI